MEILKYDLATLLELFKLGHGHGNGYGYGYGYGSSYGNTKNSGLEIRAGDKL